MGPRLRGDDPSKWYRMTKLYRLAHCRAGDKGNTTILSLIAYRQEDFTLLQARVTVEAVKRHLADIVKGDLARYELPHLWALQFVGRLLHRLEVVTLGRVTRVRNPRFDA